MIIFFQNFLIAGQEGLRLLATAVIPVLFPFFVLTSLILNLTTTTKPWLVSLLSFCSGYPNGARLSQNLYLSQRIDFSTARKLLIMTSTPSPVFVIATVGIVFLNSWQAGCLIFCSSVLGAVINSWLWCSNGVTSINTMVTTPTTNKNFFNLFSEALTNSTATILNVSGVVLFFYIFTHSLCLPNFIAGLLEMTTGVAGTVNPFLIQFLVSFGGLSVAMQQQPFVKTFQIQFPTYLAYKLTHAIIACGLFSGVWLLLN